MTKNENAGSESDLSAGVMCADCKWVSASEWDNDFHKGTDYYCRRYPEAIKVSKNHWCGEFKKSK